MDINLAMMDTRATMLTNVAKVHAHATIIRAVLTSLETLCVNRKMFKNLAIAMRKQF